MPDFKKTYTDQSARLIWELAANVVTRKFGKKGVLVTPALKRRLRKWLEAGATGKFRISKATIPGQPDLELTLTKRDQRRLWGQFEREMANRMSATVISNTVRKARPILGKVRRAWRQAAPRQSREIRAFQRRLAKRWQVPFGLLELQLQLAREIGAELNDFLRQKRRRRNAALVEALTRLHARCCQIAGEVVALLQAGYADGAMARWRSLHEVAVVLQFIGKLGNETARRYLDHDAIESRRAADLFMKHCAKLGEDPYRTDELAGIVYNFEAAVKKYGKEFAGPYGWAAQALGRNEPNFSHIEEAADLEHFRPYYKLASHGVHANPKGVLLQLGIMAGTNCLPVGPTNYGFADPGQNAALSLSQATAALVMLDPTEERLMTSQVMIELAKDVGHGFVRAQHRIEARERLRRAANPG